MASLLCAGATTALERSTSSEKTEVRPIGWEYTKDISPTNLISAIRKAARCLAGGLALVGLIAASHACAEEAANLLRNGDFQDDWITLLPENQTLHWSYLPTFTNRRDFNPDGWSLHGSWRWLDADASPGRRRLVLEAPKAEVRQRVNWVAVNDERKLEGFPDAGGFPSFAEVRSRRPLALVRDLELRVRVKGTDVPMNGAKIEVGLAPPGKVSTGDPLGTPVATTAAASSVVPAGSFDWRWVDVRLAAKDWLGAAAAAESDKENPALPATAVVVIRYEAPSGRLEIDRAELTATEPTSPNLLPNGGFENVGADGQPVGWRVAEKYTYFPPGRYYIFNSWHNEGFVNRGKPALDTLIVHAGRRSLRMPVLAGDELAVSSAPIVVDQKEPRLIEASVWVKTDRVSEIQIDARSESGERLDGYDFINKAPTSVGTNEWRLVRQVFRPREPVKSLTLVLAGRGVNGNTFGSTAEEPQNNVAGTVWWDDVRVYEPESSAEELAARGVKAAAPEASPSALRLASLDVGERLLGANRLTATIANPGGPQRLKLVWEITSPAGQVAKFGTAPLDVPAQGQKAIELPYVLGETVTPAYRESLGVLRLVGGNGDVVASTEIAFAQWSRPIDLRLGSLYLRPEQKTELVRMNLGLSHAALENLRSIRLEIVRRASGETVETKEVAATAAALSDQRERIPAALRGDFTNLLLADLDVSKLPIEPFVGPERRWFVRATALGGDGKPVASADSAPFCRQAHDAPQEPVRAVEVRRNLLYVNQRPWMPWGGTYGFVPAYDGPADPGPKAYRDLHDLPEWSLYDGYSAEPYNRHDNDLDALRQVPASVADGKTRAEVEKHWNDDGLYAATYFVAPVPGVFSWDDLAAKAGGTEKLEEVLRFVANAPMIVSTGPGFEEGFGVFHSAASNELRTLEALVRSLRAKTGKPVMVGQGGAWNRFELEKVPYFDIYDPETEPLFPANLHTELWPLVSGHDQVIWLRPQLYESIPYERWRFHTFVELMRGARGWQVAHGLGDPTLLRGLHGEIARLLPAVYSSDRGPAVEIEPWVEHWSGRVDGKTYVVAATTHSLTFGRWRWSEEVKSPGGRVRVSDGSLPSPAADNAMDRLAEQAQPGWIVHGIDSFPDARSWKPGTRLVQRVQLDPRDPPRGLALVVRTEGRWSAIASWGDSGLEAIGADPTLGYWFLRRFYRNAVGFIGYDGKGLEQSLAYVPRTVRSQGALPAVGAPVELAIDLAGLGAAGKTLDGVGFVQRGGRVFWGRTGLVTPEGSEVVLWGDALGPPPERLAHTRIAVAGLERGAKVRALFEDREINAGQGFFEDDLRGEDLYQRYGGSEGYGDTPVALHVYEVP